MEAGLTAGFVADHYFRGSCAGVRLIELFDQRCAGDSRRPHRVRSALRQISKPAGLEDVLLSVRFYFNLAVEDIKKSLCRRGAERAAGNELGGHLREARSQLRRGVNDELHSLGAGQR